MNRELFRYTFVEDVVVEEIEASLVLALLSVESLHGESQVRLDASHFFDTEQKTCVIDAGTDVGLDLNRLFIGFVRREYGEDAFTVQRVKPTRQDVLAEAAR